MAYTLCYASGGGLKTRIMANIQTPIRLINVKETYEEVLKAMDSQWMELTEDTPFDGENEWFGTISNYDKYQEKWRIVVNSGFIGESYEEAQDSCLRKLIEIVNQNKDD